MGALVSLLMMLISLSVSMLMMAIRLTTSLLTTAIRLAAPRSRRRGIPNSSPIVVVGVVVALGVLIASPRAALTLAIFVAAGGAVWWVARRYRRTPDPAAFGRLLAGTLCANGYAYCYLLSATHRGSPSSLLASSKSSVCWLARSSALRRSFRTLGVVQSGLGPLRAWHDANLFGIRSTNPKVALSLA